MAAARDVVERFGDRMAALALVRPRHPEPVPVRITRNRIYVLPTGFGLFIAMMLFSMLIGGLNYNNNPALLLVFLLAGVANNSLIQAHLALSGLRLKSVQAEPVHAGQILHLRLCFDAEGRRTRNSMELLCDGIATGFDLPVGNEAEAILELPTHRRGWFTPGRFRLSTLRPLGLARAWSWLRPQGQWLVYPAPEMEAPPLPESLGDGQSSHVRNQGEQPHHLRDYRPGDPLRQIAWKSSARADRLLSREYESAVAREIFLEWNSLTTLPYELRIRRLTRWVIEAERNSCRYALALPNERLPPGRGPEHRHACLRALALMPDG